MIMKAIEEFGENGDSSEKPISDYIKKQYKDLPWAHATLLKHHLTNLCASGDIVLTSNQTYVLPVLHSNHKSRKKSSKKKHARKKQGWDWDWCKKKNTRQKRQVGKGYMKQKKGKDHLIAEERPFCEPEGQKVTTEVHEIKVVEICSSDSQLNPIGQLLDAEAHLIAEHRPPCDSDGQASEKVHELQVVDICSSDAKLNLKEKKLDDFQTDTSTTDRPPDFVSVLESMNLPGNSQEFAVLAAELSYIGREQVHSRVNDELKQVQSVASEVSETKNQGVEQMQPSDGASDSLDQYMQALQPNTTITDIGLQQIECGEHHAMLTQAGLAEVCNQQTIPQLKPTTDETSVSKSQPVHCSGADQVQRIVSQYKKRPPGKKSKENQTKKQRSEEFEPVEQVQKQLDEKPTTDETSVSKSQPVHCSGADQVRRIMYQYKKRPPGKKSKENQTKKQRMEEFEPLEQVQKQLDERPTTDETSGSKPQPVHCSGADQVRRIVLQYKRRPPGMKSKENQTKKQRLEEFEPLEQVQKQLDENPLFLLDPQCTKPIDSNEQQVLSGSANESHQELQLKRQDECLVQETMCQGTRMQRKLRSWKNDSADGPQEKPLKSVEGPQCNTAEEVLLSDSVHIRHLEKTSDKPKHQSRGRPRKMKTVTRSVNNKSLASGVVIRKPGYRSRGRPHKII